MPQDINTISNLLNSLSENDDIYISPTETNFNIDGLIDLLKNKNIKVNFYITSEPIIEHNLVMKLLPHSNKMFLMNNSYDIPNVHNMPIGIRDCETVVSKS